MVSRTYLLAKDGPPASPPKIFLDRTVVPALINAAGDVEAMLERIAARTRNAPIPAAAAAFGVGLLLSVVLMRRR